MAGRRPRTALVATLVAVALLALGASRPADAAPASPIPVPVPVSRALDLLAAGDARSATLSGPSGDVTLTLRAGGRVLTTALPYPALVEQAVAAARAGDVPLRVTRPRAAPTAATPAPSGGGFDPVVFMREWGGMILLLVLVAFTGLALRQVGGARFGHRVKPVRSVTRFEDVAGIDEIRDEVTEIADVLSDPERFERVGADLPRGVILHGAPGTGKTLLARAVAGEAGVPFFSASGSEFVEVYSGLGAKRIRALFDAARKAAPAVLYIDEIDAVGGRRTGAPGSGEREQALDQLLTEMDGFRTDPHRPVVVLASTNRIEDLDPALVRAGRFDRRIAVGLPDRQAREEILGVHTRRRPLAPGTRLADVAAFTAGMAGADLAALCNEAAFEAARGGRETLELADFRRALMRLAAGPEKRSRVMSDEERALVAYHEMGHAIVGHLSPRCDPVERVTVIPQGQALGVTIALPTEDRFLATREDCLQRLAMMMGGRAAEELIFEEQTSGAADDLARAHRLARRMVEDLGMGAPTTERSISPEDGPGGEEGVERRAAKLVEDAYLQARGLLARHEETLHHAAARLLAAEALERDDLHALLGPRPSAGRLTPRREAVVAP
ncbi:MAG: ATP-dependent metallopeptidase FtsH/Yme1/Tma family protein [Thermoleophilia bacterium]|nr:ATP-dependent metallopeptidase FtsH/Yme1/Tma family protein [Thermoleophilia bacterium]